MSNDVIYRSDAIKAVWKPIVYPNAVIFDALKRAIESEISNIPSAQPERKKGKWIYGEHDVAMCDGYRCNRCGFFVPWDYEHKFIDFINDYHYCPNCGAYMRGDSDETD